jgi:serine/threonine-protein kinase
MAELAAGTTIAGKYRVKRRIGAGGMGAVYEGEHVEIGKRVAIKVIEHENARSEELAARFRREARAASAVESEHIVHVFDVGQDDAVGLYMVMEFLVGEDLDGRLRRSGGKLPLEEATTIGVQVGRALAKAHAAGVIHRDLKPANVFLTTREDGSTLAKILDFGISKLAKKEDGEKASHTLTREGAVIGTPLYMSPEQAQGMAVDARTDVWSLGAVLYEAISGKTPFEDKPTYEQMIVQIATKRPAPLRELAPFVPEAIAAVVDEALAHDAAARLPDAATFARRLAEAAKLPAPPPSDPRLEAPISSTGGRPPPATATPVVVGVQTQLDAGLPPKRGALRWVAVAGAVVVLLVVVAFATRKGEHAPAAGLVEPSVPPTAPSALVSAALATAAPPATLAPLATQVASAPAPSASILVKPAAKAPPAKTAPPSTNAPKSSPTQYGGAGVSTAY